MSKVGNGDLSPDMVVSNGILDEQAQGLECLDAGAMLALV